MRTRLLILVVLSIATTLLHAASDGKIAFVNGTLIEPAAAKVTPNSLERKPDLWPQIHASS